MNPDPLYVETTDDEPWPVYEPATRRDPRRLVALLTLTVLLVVLALVARR